MRCHASAATYYGYYGSASNSQPFKMVAETWTQIGSDAAGFTAGDVVRLEVEGTTLRAYFRRAQGEGIVRGVNPASALMDKPQIRAVEAPWLEVWEGALLLEAARTFTYDGPESSTVGERLAAP